MGVPGAFSCSTYTDPIMTLVVLPMVWAAHVPPCSILTAELGWSWRLEPGCPAACLINHPALYMTAVFPLVAPSTGVMAVRPVGLFSDGDAVTAGAGSWPCRLHLFCADTTQSVPLPDPLALAPPTKKSPPVTMCSPRLSHFSVYSALKKYQPWLRPEAANLQF